VRKEAKATEERSAKSKKKQQRTKLPPIFPLVVYQHKRKWNAPQQFHDLIEAANEWQPYLPAFKYELVSVASLRETELFSAVLLRAAIRLMRHIFDPDLADKLPQIWAEFRDLAWGPDEQGFLLVMLSYVSSTNANVTPGDLKRSLEIAFPQEGDHVMTTMAQQWLEEGKQQALLTSIRSGLEVKFSAGYESLLQEIEKIHDPVKLQLLLTLLFKVNSLAEFQTAYRSLVTNEHEAATDAHLN